MEYKDKISHLLDAVGIEIDRDIQVSGRTPTTVSSEFITNKEQGDWAERLVFDAINRLDNDFVAVRYGRNEDISAGDTGFKEFYKKYQDELNTIGKKPDILIFHKKDLPNDNGLTDEQVSKAVCALEVRSSSFLVNKYNVFMKERTDNAYREIEAAISHIKANYLLNNLLKAKDMELYNFISSANRNTFSTIMFKKPGWRSTPALRELSDYLGIIKDNIKIIQRRDFLSITPKIEDIALVNRWIQRYNVPHYYLQVFFDCGYIISFEDVLTICSDGKREGHDFSIESDVKNQGKYTIKINVHSTDLILDKIEMPEHFSQMKELERGRLLFYVTFKNSRGQLNMSIFNKIIS